MDAIASLLASLEALFTEFNLRRLFYWLSLPILAITGLIIWETFTDSFFLARMERRLSLLRELHSLAKDGITQNSELAPSYQEMARQLAEYKVRSFSLVHILNYPDSEQFFKFITGGIWGLAVAVSALSDKGKGKEQWKSTLYGGLVFAAVLGFISTLIPTIYSPWVNYIGWPALQLLLILGLSKLTSTVKKR